MGQIVSANRPVFVLDASLAFAWFFADEQNAYADAVARALPAASAIVPDLWHLEVANVLVIGERRKRCTAKQSEVFLSRLELLPIQVDPDTILNAWSETIRLARAMGLTAYDAAYLELAIRLQLPLATLDDKLRSAALANTVGLYQP